VFDLRVLLKISSDIKTSNHQREMKKLNNGKLTKKTSIRRISIFLQIMSSSQDVQNSKACAEILKLKKTYQRALNLKKFHFCLNLTLPILSLPDVYVVRPNSHST